MGTVQTARADIVVRDKDDGELMLVEVKARVPGREVVERLREVMEEANGGFRFAMLADPERIQVFGWEGSRLSGPLCSLSTASVLKHYDEEFGTKRVSGYYFETLVESWLRDVAYHWKSAAPPGCSELEAIGLAQLLAGGSTETQTSLSA